MYTQLTRMMMIPAIAVAMLVMAASAQAQGTANGPFTQHNVDPGPIVFIGDAANPIPIDLDPLGPPWTKDIFDPNGLHPNGGPLDINELILNVGTEPWFDWHEHILPDFTGVIPGVWIAVQLTVNGNPIGFNVIGLNTPDLWLDTFSQPVMPGDVLNIRKVADVFPSGPSFPGQPLLTIQEYPTPEPASAALIGMGSLVLMTKRRAVTG